MGVHQTGYMPPPKVHLGCSDYYVQLAFWQIFVLSGPVQDTIWEIKTDSINMMALKNQRYSDTKIQGYR